ncbi:MAG: hypothetical protein MMC33_001499 [Icmadophila ericetorum]|nr:hypothetical protein [Icmadophila ericetorum]
MSEELVDLSLFSDDPRDIYNYHIQEIPPYRGARDESSAYQQSQPYRGPSNYLGDRHRNDWTLHYQEYYQPVPLALGLRPPSNKPLPPLPSRTLCERRMVVRRGEPRCILQRIRRVKTDNPPRKPTGSIQQRRNAPSVPQLSVSVPQVSLSVPEPRREQGDGPRRASPMVWLPDEQMWLIVEPEEYEAYQAYAREQETPPPAYMSPRSVRSAPPSSRPESEQLSPVRSQFRTLMARRPEHHTPTLQEAMYGVPMYDHYDDEEKEEEEEYEDDFELLSPAPLRIERGWRPERTSSLSVSDSFYGAQADDKEIRGPLTDDISFYQRISIGDSLVSSLSPRSGFLTSIEWPTEMETLALEITRPFTAN